MRRPCLFHLSDTQHKRKVTSLQRERDPMNTFRALTLARTEHHAAIAAYDRASNRFRLTPEITARYRESVRLLAVAELAHDTDPVKKRIVA